MGGSGCGGDDTGDGSDGDTGGVPPAGGDDGTGTDPANIDGPVPCPLTNPACNAGQDDGQDGSDGETGNDGAISTNGDEADCVRNMATGECLPETTAPTFSPTSLAPTPSPTTSPAPSTSPAPTAEDTTRCALTGCEDDPLPVQKVPAAGYEMRIKMSDTRGGAGGLAMQPGNRRNHVKGNSKGT